MPLKGNDHHRNCGAVSRKGLYEGSCRTDEVPKGPIGGDKADYIDGNVKGRQQQVAQGEIENEEVGRRPVGALQREHYPTDEGVSEEADDHDERVGEDENGVGELFSEHTIFKG